MSQPLDGGSPRRLLHQAGKWVLEVVRHVNLAPGLIRPTTQRLSGNRVITSYFTSNPDKAGLGKAAQRLMHAQSGSEPRSYTAVGSEWVVNSMPPPRGDSLESYPPPALTAALDTQVDELKAQVVLLTVVQEGLLTRLARVEAKLARGSWSADGGPDAGVSSSRGGAPERGLASAVEAAPPSSSPGSPRALDGDSMPSHDPKELAGDPEPSATGAPPGPVPPPSSAVAAPAAATLDAAAPDALPLATPPAVNERKELELPPVSDLTKCIAMLVGGDVSAHDGSPLAVNRTTRDCYAAAILDDSDRAVGLILMDLKATVYLGGMLMMLPKAEMDLQLKAASPAPDAIAASSEICNALSGAINGAQSQHVRMGPLDKFEFKSWSWVTEPAHRRDLEDSLGGRTVVFSRPLPRQIS